MKKKNFLLRTGYLVLTLAMFFSVGFFTNIAQAATGDISAVRVRSDGWTVDIDITNFTSTTTANNMGLGVNNDPTNAKISFDVTSPGFDASGNVTTSSRVVYGTKIVRLPYPSDSQLDETLSAGKVTIRVSLSDFIYSGDTSITANISAGWFVDNGPGGTGLPNNAVTGLSVTNNSTLAYPKVIGRWAWPGYERVTGDFMVEAVAFHRFAQNGKPVAAVGFSASDQHGNTAYATSTSMTVSTRGGDANTVLVYAATLPVASLTQGDVIDVNLRAYPWVGDSVSVLDSRTTADGVAQPKELFGPLAEMNDKSGTYGVAYAYVSTTTGVDGTGTVYTSQAAAEAGNAYKTIEKAAEGVKAYNNTNFSRNEAGGGVILVAEGTYPFPGASSADLGAMTSWLTIKPASTALKANTIIGPSPSVISIKAIRTKVEGFTIAGGSSSNIISGSSTAGVLWLHNNSISSTGAAAFTNFKVGYATDNSITSLTQGFSAFGGNNPFSLVRGNTAVNTVRSSFYTVLGNKNITGAEYPEYNANKGAVSDNAVFAYNTIYNLTNSSLDWAQISKISHGIAIIQNLVETLNNTSFALVEVGSTSNTATTTNNILFWHNTFEGERANVAYLVNGTENFDKLNWSNKFNIFHEWNIKTDTFTGGVGGPNGARVANWPAVHNVGSFGNISEQYNFAGDFHGIYTTWAPSGGPNIRVGFVNDASAYGSGLGSGNYNLLATSTAIDVATSSSAFSQILPFDIFGNPRYGAPDTGAVEYQPTYTMGVHTLATSTVNRVYGDGKFRSKTATTTNGTANLNVTLSGSDKTQWLDIAVSTSTWLNTGTRHKIWTETSSTTGLTNTLHVVGDLAPSTGYDVSVNGVLGSNITGGSCSAGTCTSDGTGKITFTYGGTYSSAKTFDVLQQANTIQTLVTSAPTQVSTSTITMNATISSTGGADATQSGFAYGTVASLSTVIATSTLGAQSGTATFNQALTSLTPNTLYYFRAYTTNTSGTAYGTILSTTTKDITAPSVVITSPSGGATVAGSSVTLSATASDDVAVAGVQFKLDGTSNIGSEITIAPYNTSWNSTGITSFSSHSIYAVARDAGGNYATSTVTINVDNVAPTIVSAVRNSDTQITVTLSKLANAGTITKANNGGFTITKTGSPGTTFAVSSIAPGADNTKVVLTIADMSSAGGTGVVATYTAGGNGTVADGLGNLLATDNTGITVPPWNTTAPIITNITSTVPNGAYKQGDIIDINLTFSKNVNSTGSVSVTLNTGGSCGFTVSDSSSASCNYTVGPSQGTLALNVSSVSGTITSTDSNPMTVFTPAVNLSANKSIVIDTSAPSVGFTTPTNGATVTGSSVTLTVTSSDTDSNIAGVRFKLDGNTNIGVEGSTNPYSITWNSSSVADGSHTLSGVARDMAGNYATSTITVTVNNAIVDSTPPVLSAGSPSGSLSAGTTGTTLTVTTDETATCKYDTASGVAYASQANTFSTTGGTTHSTSVTGLSNGSTYNYYVRCMDTATNPNVSDYTITFSVANPAPSGGGGGGGGGGSSSSSSSSGTTIYNLSSWSGSTTQATGNSLTQSATTTCNLWAYPQITKTLSEAQGSTGSDVTLLQKILNLEKYLPVNSINGTYDVGTTFAVKALQTKYAIVSSGSPSTTGFGNVGPKTRLTINQLLNSRVYPSLGQCISSTISKVSASTTITSTATSTKTNTKIFSQPLKRGSSGPDVKALQIFLNNHEFIVTTNGNGSPGKETEYFGQATEDALKRFQEFYKDKILLPYGLTVPTGFFGTYTMQFVNAM